MLCSSPVLDFSSVLGPESVKVKELKQIVSIMISVLVSDAK